MLKTSCKSTRAPFFTLWGAKMEQKDIAKRIRELQRERGHRLKELMAKYDAEVYYPERTILVKACKELGHHRGSFHDNILGWCSVCGSSFDRQKT